LFSSSPKKRSGLLKFVDITEKRDGKVGPALFTRLVGKAYNTKEINGLLQDAEKRFGKLSWQLLAAGAHRAANPKVNNPSLGARLLQRIPKQDISRVYEGVIRAVLGNASKHHDTHAANIAFDMIPFENRSPTDNVRLIHAGVDSKKGRELIDQVLSKPCCSSSAAQIDVRVLGVFLKFCSKIHDIDLAQRVWTWGETSRYLAADKQDLGFITVQFLLLSGRAGNLQLTQKVWKEAISCGIHTQPEVIGAILSVLASHGEADQTESLLARIPPEHINAPMLTAALTAYSHNGRADEAWDLLKRIENISHRISGASAPVGLYAYTAVVDAYARKGEFDSALEVVQKAKQRGLTPDTVMWMTILSPCRHYANLSVAVPAFNSIKKIDSTSDEMAAAAYVLMADVYKACGDLDAADSLQKERIDRGYVKERGAVTVTVHGRTHTFHVDQIPSELASETPRITAKLKEWSVWLAGQGVSIESIQCRHSEKLALAYAVCEGVSDVVLRKNLRICSACHEASRQITKFEAITIRHWDRSRVHVMMDGKCSCGGYY